MEFTELQPDLKQWMQQAVERGQCQANVMDALLKAGYQPSIERAVEQCIAAYSAGGNVAAGSGAQPDAGTTAVTPPQAATEEEYDGSRFCLFHPQKNLYDLGDQQVEVLLAMQRPNVVLFGNLLSESECDALIELSRPRLKRSRVVNSESGTFDLGDVRTSSGTYFESRATPLIAAIEARIERLLGVPESRGEPIQVLHYQEGAEYRPHFDFFNPQKPGNQKVLARGGQRVGTLVMYLNNVEAGGSTVFPKVSLDVMPKKGCGLFFSFANDEGELDRLTLHGGSPVIAGEKWIATRWLRLHDYRVSDA
ncbi:2OG-Fe(II) oxygenase [Microbulbifer sp. Q7]|uniref:2OG-Fe(II) oxygenase n=1 Tax=Microbulbifer sp. Q7 TaxID=1785091 RepID=UPI000AAA27A4|nr:2OG-Fe(II) oxygenase [Microbulbifer sp. Q7]